MATSRLEMRSPSIPMPTPAASVKPSSPQIGAMPIKPAPVAPAKPMWESAWPAKVWPRITRKKPTIPETAATMPAAANALIMNSY